MRITEVTTSVGDLDAAERFYGEVLGLPTRRDPGASSVRVRVGATLLRLVHRPVERTNDHLAFTIPAIGFAAAKRWLQARVRLYERDGADEFEGPPSWDSRSLYFAGPSESVLELIARRRLPGAAREPFTAAELVSISEVGVAVADVPEAIRVLGAAGADVFGEPPDDRFAAVGDEHGLLVLAAEGRPWFPTRDRHARRAPATVTAVGGRSAEVFIGSTRVTFQASGRPDEDPPSP